MRLTFIGTGAADWDWRNMPPDTRGSTATLIGKSCLIDAGPTVIRSLEAAGVKPSQIAHVIITHSHSDHLQPSAIAYLAEARHEKLTVWASPQSLAMLEGIPCLRHEVAAGMAFKCGRLTFTVLPANHETLHPEEESLHYLVESGGKTLLYALDGAWMLAKARSLLTKSLGGRTLDAVIWDATCGPTLNDWRFAEHNDLAMIDAMRKSMLGAGLVSSATRHVFDHLARTLWPEEAAARAALATAYGGTLAEDGGRFAV
jgi:adenosylcobinamide kinase/adenosylcobinamide-phosphate guanylyltransferase